MRTKAIVVLCARDDCTAIPDEKSEDIRSKANVTSPRIALLGAITRLGAAICNHASAEGAVCYRSVVVCCMHAV